MKFFASFSVVFLVFLSACSFKPKPTVPQPVRPVTVAPPPGGGGSGGGEPGGGGETGGPGGGPVVPPDEDLLPAAGFYNNANGSPVFGMLKAKHTIDIEIYQMEDADVRADLRAAIARKVRIRVVKEPKPLGDDCSIFEPVDPKDDETCRDQKALKDEIVAAGGAYVPFNKQELCGTSPQYCWEHGKMVIADGRAVMLSTGNFNSSNLCNLAQNPAKCNRDYSVVSRDAKTIHFLREVFEKDLAQKRYDLPAILAASGLEETVTVSPHSLGPLTRFVQSARRSIRLQNQYFKEETFNNALMEIARKDSPKVHVEMTLASLCAHGRPNDQDRASATELFTAFEGAGIKVKILPKAFLINGKPGYLHSKAILIDDVRAWVGSVNGSRSGLSNNREFGIFFSQPTWVSPLLDVLVSDHTSLDTETWQESLDCLKD